jgi:hypothetical protein
MWMAIMPTYANIASTYHMEVFWEVVKNSAFFEFIISVTVASFFFPYAILWNEYISNDKCIRCESITSTRFSNLVLVTGMSNSFVVLPLGLIFFNDTSGIDQKSIIGGLVFLWIVHGIINSLHIFYLNRKNII